MRQHLFEIDNGRPYEPMLINGKRIELFMIYGRPIQFQPAPALAGFERIALIRDPIARFLSAYANRVLDPRWRNRNHEQLCEAMGLPATPSIDIFINHLKEYQQIPEIGHHTKSQVFFLGDKLDYYDRLFRVESILEAAQYLERRSGLAIDFPRLKTDGPKARRSDLDTNLINRLRQYLESDYSLLGHIYPC